MTFAHLPACLSAGLAALAGVLDRRSAPRRLRLFGGALCARGRRTVTAWFRAAGITDDCRPASNARGAAGRNARFLAARLLVGALLPLRGRLPGERWLVARDDTPAPRYGPRVQGAGIPHNPAPGPAGEQFVYGHLWVPRAWLVHHPTWHTRAWPLHALLDVRAKDVPELSQDYPWTFHTKLEWAVTLVRWLVGWLGHRGKALWLVVEGAYAQKPFLQPVLTLGLVVRSRLRKDAALRGVPPPQRRRGHRGPLPTYGRDTISLAKRAGPKRGWQTVPCRPYGRQVVKTIKTFLATWRPAGGRSRVGIVGEEHGWLAFFGSNPEVPVSAILEARADRGAIEQTFKDVKEVGGAGQQQVRNVDASSGAFAVNLSLYRLVAAWSWSRAAEDLVDRRRSPWDTEERRPSPADKRKALPRVILREEIQAAVARRVNEQELQEITLRLLDLVA